MLFAFGAQRVSRERKPGRAFLERDGSFPPREPPWLREALGAAEVGTGSAALLVVLRDPVISCLSKSDGGSLQCVPWEPLAAVQVGWTRSV